MKWLTSLTVGLVAAGPCAIEAVPVIGKTVPVGIIKLGDTTVDEPSVQANTDVYISIPLLKPETLRGDVTSISGSTVTLTSSTSAASLSGPHYLVIESGAKAGLIALVTASTSNTVTVSLQPDDSLSGIVSSDDLTLRPAWTVGSLMGFNVPTGTALLGYSGTGAGGANPSADLWYEFDGTDWIDYTSTFLPANDDVLYPNEAFILRSPSANSVDLVTVIGEVSQLPSRFYILNIATSGRGNPFSYFGSADEAIVDSGVASIAGAGDQILARDNSTAGLNKASTESYEFDGSDWIDLSDFSVINGSVKFEAGKSYLYYRHPSSSMTPTLWSDLPEYLPLD